MIEWFIALKIVFIVLSIVSAFSILFCVMNIMMERFDSEMFIRLLILIAIFSTLVTVTVSLPPITD